MVHSLEYILTIVKRISIVMTARNLKSREIVPELIAQRGDLFKSEKIDAFVSAPYNFWPGLKDLIEKGFKLESLRVQSYQDYHVWENSVL